MTVERLMTKDVQTCRAGDSLDDAARIMWDCDCGCVPVVTDGDGGVRVVGMLTDRDICMAGYTQGRRLCDIPVASAMSREVCSCRTSDSIGSALRVMRTKQVHRLPVVDAQEQLVGMLSFADVAREAAREPARMKPQVPALEVAETIEGIRQPRESRDVSGAA